jgi:hypothetical protein
MVVKMAVKWPGRAVREHWRPGHFRWNTRHSSVRAAATGWRAKRQSRYTLLAGSRLPHAPSARRSPSLLGEGLDKRVLQLQPVTSTREFTGAHHPHSSWKRRLEYSALARRAFPQQATTATVATWLTTNVASFLNAAYTPWRCMCAVQEARIIACMMCTTFEERRMSCPLSVLATIAKASKPQGRGLSSAEQPAHRSPSGEQMTSR